MEMYFGTIGNMRWVKPPAINTPLGLTTAVDSGIDVNGGGYVLNGPASHRNYDFQWGAAPARDVYAITDYASGAYGSGLIYFLDPFAMSTNILPADFSLPERLVKQGLSQTSGTTVVDATVVGGAPNQPNAKLIKNLNSPEIYIPVPTGYRLWISAVASGQFSLYVNTVANSSAATVPLTAPTSATLSWTSYTGGRYLRIFTGLSGGTVRGLMAVVLPEGQTPANNLPWTVGKGNSGCRFVGYPQVTGISAALGAHGLVSASAELKEVGLWQRR